MSQEKTIRISPELFSLKSNKNKTLKNKGKEKKPDIKINNAIKNKLIEKVKEYQKKNKDEILEKNNKESIQNKQTIENTQFNEYEDSLNFLKILSDKDAKNKQCKHAKTLKSLTSENIFVHTELPDNFKVDLDKKTFEHKDTPYGCLKNGIKPTYRQWLKNTQKNKIHTELNSKLNNIQISDSPKIFDAPIVKPNSNTSKLFDAPLIKPNSDTSKVFDSPIVKPNSDTLKVFDAPIIKPNSDNNENIIEIEEKKDPEYDEFKINLHRNTKTLKYQLGKRKNKIGVLIKNNKTLKKIKNDSTILKKTPIIDVKNYLRKHNLIKVGCSAPTDVLRKIYESSILSGNITNTNSNNLLHNFLSNNE